MKKQDYILVAIGLSVIVLFAYLTFESKNVEEVEVIAISKQYVYSSFVYSVIVIDNYSASITFYDDYHLKFMESINANKPIELFRTLESGEEYTFVFHLENKFPVINYINRGNKIQYWISNNENIQIWKKSMSNER